MKLNIIYKLTVFTLTVFIISSCTVYKSTKKWELSWEEDFSELRDSVWEVSDRFFSNDIVKFVPGNVQIRDSALFLEINKPNKRNKYYEGAEISTRETFGYGLYEVVMKPAEGNGIVSSFFTLMATSRPGNEIDIEFLGKNPRFVVFNTWDKKGRENPLTYRLPFIPTKKYHSYAFEWAPRKITWYVDGKKKHSTRKSIPKTPHHIFMNIWVSENEDWVGKPARDFEAAKAVYQSVRFYSRKERK